jgi:predicted Zn-dependent protease with MMP-like domain
LEAGTVQFLVADERSRYSRGFVANAPGTVTALSRSAFERVVEDALASLPKRFTDLMENVLVSVEDEPSVDDLRGLADNDDETELLGIYRGVALTDREGHDPYLPDEIAIFRRPINRIARDCDEAIEEVRETVIHEIGH